MTDDDYGNHRSLFGGAYREKISSSVCFFSRRLRQFFFRHACKRVRGGMHVCVLGVFDEVIKLRHLLLVVNFSLYTNVVRRQNRREWKEREILCREGASQSVSHHSFWKIFPRVSSSASFSSSSYNLNESPSSQVFFFLAFFVHNYDYFCVGLNNHPDDDQVGKDEVTD